MADLTINIHANSEETVKAFKEVADSSEETREKLTKYASAFNEKKLDEFIEKQKKIGVAMTAAGKESTVLTTQTKNYQQEIQKLVMGGLTPESEQVKKLRAEYDKLKGQTDSVSKSKSNLKSQIAAMVPAIGAALAAYKALSGTLKTIKKFMDDSIQAYTEQEKANAKLESVLFATGAAAWTTSEQMKEFSKNLAGETGNSKKDIEDLQSVLLGFRSITGDVFNDSTEAIVQMAGVMGGDLKSAANSFGKALDTPIEGMAALSRYGFVFTDQEKEMVKELEAAGKHEEAQRIVLDAMTSSFGNAATAMNSAVKSQNDYKTSVENLKIAMGEDFNKKITPFRNFLTDIFTNFANATEAANEYKNAVERIKNAKYGESQSEAIQQITDLITKYETVIKKDEDLQKSMSRQGVQDSNLEKRLGANYALVEGLREQKEELLEQQRIQQEQAAEEARNAAAREKAEEAARNAAESATQQLIKDRQKYIESLEELHIKNDDIKNDERQLLELQLAREEAAINASGAEQKAIDDTLIELRKLYAARLEMADESFNSDLLKEQLESFRGIVKEEDSILTQERIDNLRIQQALMLAQFEEGSAAYLEALKETDKIIKDEEKKTADFLINLKARELNAMADLFGSLSDIIQSFGEDNVAAAKLAKVLAAAQAGINSYLAFTQALKDENGGPMWLRMIMAGTVLAAGIAQQVKIWNTPLPSAETGARFIVPQSVGSDSTLMRVNSGEEVDVTPRGMTGFTERQTITVQIEKQTIFDVVNDGIRGGDILIQATNY
jgi:hypothetical protein